VKAASVTRYFSRRFANVSAMAGHSLSQIDPDSCWKKVRSEYYPTYGVKLEEFGLNCSTADSKTDPPKNHIEKISFEE
jgi:hypothetical protein